ncbi:MAG: pyridoxamine 5'-phosphate oxidase family protein [Acidobacteria bacterium]|nr:pyridoxamine 5'-phosphate oxidase family protein [Acidobacteriota bacterium]
MDPIQSRDRKEAVSADGRLLRARLGKDCVLRRVCSDQVWREIEKQIFAVIATVTPHGEPRTAGIVYIVRNRRIYIAIGRDSWKARNIAGSPNVAMTVTVAKRIPFFPWIKIPAATISFHGEAALRSWRGCPPASRRGVARDS